MTSPKKTATSEKLIAPTEHVGDRYYFSRKTWELVNLDWDADEARFMEVCGTAKATFSISKFLNDLRRGSITKEFNVSPLALAALNEADLDESGRVVYDFRCAVASALDALPNRTAKERQNEIILNLWETHSALAKEKKVAGLAKPVYQTARDWVNAYRAAGTLIVLAFPNQRKKKRKRRLLPDQEKYIRQVFKDSYAKENRISIEAAWTILYKQVYQHNLALPPGAKAISVPSKKTFTERLKELNGIHATQQRHGAKAARRASSHGGGIPIPRHLCEVVFADCQMIDVMVYDPELDFAYRPFLIIFFCLASHCIIGWEISATAPGKSKFCRGLRTCLSETEGYIYRGVPVLIVVDNGVEFDNEVARELSDRLKITIEYAPGATPNAKAHAESFFDTLNEYFHALPGSAYSNPEDRGNYDSEGNAIYTLEEAREKFGDFLDIKHLEPHSRTNISANTKWHTLYKRFAPRLFDAEFSATLGTNVRNITINRGRIEVEKLSWHSPALVELGIRLKGASRKAKVYIDEDDLTYAWVRHPQEPNTYIRCDPVNPAYQNGLTMAAHKEFLQEAKEREITSGNLHVFLMLKATFFEKAIAEAMESVARRRNKSKRKHAETQAGLSKANIQKAKLTNPPPTVPTPTPAPKDIKPKPIEPTATSVYHQSECSWDAARANNRLKTV